MTQINNTTDLFGILDQQPIELQNIFKKEIESYQDCEKTLKECQAIGYTFDYYLDAQPYNLTKITPSKSDLKKKWALIKWGDFTLKGKLDQNESKLYHPKSKTLFLSLGSDTIILKRFLKKSDLMEYKAFKTSNSLGWSILN